MLAVLLLAVASSALASPAAPPSHSRLSHSEFFNLLISVSNPSSDFSDSPVNGLQLDAVHVGAGLNAPTPAAKGATFFSTVNQTVRLANTGTNPYGFVISDQPEEADGKVYDLGINIGTGMRGFAVAGEGKCLELRAPRKGTFAVCDTGFEAYAHPKRVLKFVDRGEKDGYVPGDCTAVSLVPVCADGEGDGESEGVVVRCHADQADVTLEKGEVCW